MYSVPHLWPLHARSSGDPPLKQANTYLAVAFAAFSFQKSAFHYTVYACFVPQWGADLSSRTIGFRTALSEWAILVYTVKRATLQRQDQDWNFRIPLWRRQHPLALEKNQLKYQR